MPKFDSTPLDRKIEWQRMVNNLRMQVERSLQSFSGDGSAIDMLAWTKLWCGPVMSQTQMAELIDPLKVHVSEVYTHIFYLPFNVIPVEDDNRRIVNLYTLEHIDDLISAECDRIGKRVYRISQLSKEDRMQEVISVVCAPGPQH